MSLTHHKTCRQYAAIFKVPKHLRRVVAIELKGDMEIELCQMSIQIMYKYSSFLKESMQQSNRFVSGPMVLDFSITDSQDHYEARSLFDEVLVEGDTVVIYAHCVRSTHMTVIINLEFNPVDDDALIQS